MIQTLYQLSQLGIACLSKSTHTVSEHTDILLDIIYLLLHVLVEFKLSILLLLIAIYVMNLFLLLNFNILVCRLPVQVFNLLLSVLINRLLEIASIPEKSFTSDLDGNIWVLREDLLKQELFGQGKCFDFFGSNVNVLRSLVVDDVVVADQAVRFQFLGSFVLSLGDTVSDQRVADVDGSIKNEVHFRDFIFFIIDDPVFVCCHKSSWHEAESNIV